MTRVENNPPGFARNWHTEIVCREHKTTLKALQTPDKRWPVVRARRELWFRLVIVQGGCSLPMAARYLKKDHTTALYALRRYCTENYGTAPDATLKDMRAAYRAALAGFSEEMAA